MKNNYRKIAIVFTLFNRSKHFDRKEVSMTIRERIILIIKNEGVNVNSFSKKIGTAQSSIQSMIDKNTEPSSKTLVKILNVYPLISAEWLLRGEGYMYKNDQKASISVDATVHNIKNNSGQIETGVNSTVNNDQDMLNVIRQLQETISKQQETIAKLVEKL